MLFNFKDVFLNEEVIVNYNYELDMRSVDLNGIYPFSEPVKVHVQAENRAGLVRLTLNTCTTYLAPCDRCGVILKKVYDFTFEHILVTSLNGDADDEYIETSDYELELDDIVMADILLELPSKFLCSNKCKGLCPDCGKNLNTESCDCRKKRIDPRLEALKQLLD